MSLQDVQLGAGVLGKQHGGGEWTKRQCSGSEGGSPSLCHRKKAWLSRAVQLSARAAEKQQWTKCISFQKFQKCVSVSFFLLAFCNFLVGEGRDNDTWLVRYLCARALRLPRVLDELGDALALRAAWRRLLRAALQAEQLGLGAVQLPLQQLHRAVVLVLHRADLLLWTEEKILCLH